MKVGELAFVLLIACGVLASVWLLSVDSAALPLRPPAQPKRAQLRPQPIPSNFNFPLSSHTANAVASSPSSTSSTTSSVTTTKTPGTPARGQRVDQVSARLDLALETADASLGNATLGSRPVPTQLLVLGMHHSGTSLLARCLVLMGASGGARHDLHLQKGPEPKKWWERKDVINLNLLLMLKSTEERDKWYTGFGYKASNALDNVTQKVFEYRARRVVSKMNRLPRPWVVKEPRMCITMQHWRPLFDAPVCVILYRHPLAVTRGLLKHWPKVNQQFSEREWLMLWQKYVESSLRGCAGLPTVLVSHEQLAAEPYEALELMYDDLVRLGVEGLSMPDKSRIDQVFGEPFFHAPTSSVKISSHQYRLFRAMDTNQVHKEFYLKSGDSWNWWDDYAPELEGREDDYKSQWHNANVDAIDYTPFWRTRADKRRQKRHKGAASKPNHNKNLDVGVNRNAAARRLLGFEEDDDDKHREKKHTNDQREKSDEYEISEEDQIIAKLHKRMKEAARVNAPPIAKQRIATWHESLVQKAHALEDSGVEDDVMDSILEKEFDRQLEFPEITAAPSASEPLSAILERIADLKTRDVVAIYGNTAFANLTRNLICHMKRLEMSNFVVLALDDTLCGEIDSLKVACFYDTRFGVGFNEHQRWNNVQKSHYFRMLQLKLSYLAQIIGLGYNVLLSDVDIAYVENPLAYARNVLSSAENGDKYDMLIQSDTRPQVEESANWVCAGNFYLRATNAAAEFVREVSLCMHRTGFPDQDCMQLILFGNGQELVFPPHTQYRSAADMGFVFALADPLHWANGGVYFAAEYNEKFGVEPVLVHANQNWDKVSRLKRAELWALGDNGECPFA